MSKTHTLYVYQTFVRSTFNPGSQSIVKVLAITIRSYNHAKTIVIFKSHSLSNVEHHVGGLVQLDKGCIADLTEAKKLKDLLDAW